MILIGFMGAGKTTVGKKLAQATGLEHIDFDHIIVEEIGMSIQEYFDCYGEESFREKETQILERSLSSNRIISTGGGIVLKKKNRHLLKQMPAVIYLKTTADELICRLKNDKTTIRPLIVSRSPEEIKEVYLPRVPFYEESATIIIETTGKNPDEISREILNKVSD